MTRQLFIMATDNRPLASEASQLAKACVSDLLRDGRLHRTDAIEMRNCAGVEKETFRLAGQRPRPGWGPASAWRRIALIPWLTLDGPTEEDGGNGEILLEPDDPESYVS